MLVTLNIKNVVLIEHLEIHFRSGLCALTGETGAGKSILLDSLGLALGARADTGLIRKGQEQASVTAEFQIHPGHQALKILKEFEIFGEEDRLILRRVVTTTGKSRAFINDESVSLALLKKVGEALVEIHGQFETQGLLNPATHIDMLDEYAKIEHSLSEKWSKWKDEQQVLDEMQKSAEHSKIQENYIRTSLEDLITIDPKVGEEQTLADLKEGLKHRQNVLSALGNADQMLSDIDEPLRRICSVLDKISDKVGSELLRANKSLDIAMSEIEEAASIIREISERIQETDNNLENIEERLFSLRAQARKHACKADDLPQIKELLSQKLNLIDQGEGIIAAQKKKCDEAFQAYVIDAKNISQMREKAAQQLNLLVQKELAPLKLEKARFVASVEKLPQTEWGAKGIDSVRFLVSTNPGSEPGAIHKIASGGEMSRFMLALKVVIAQKGSTHSFIFDEVDTGIGGSTADAVGERLLRLSKDKQVLVVTHAPQVAARAKNHWVVEKTGNKIAITTIKPLTTRDQRCEEIARMISGATITSEARAAASKLLENAA